MSGGGQDDALELVAEYEPDEETEARVLLMVLGFPEEEIERIVGEMFDGQQVQTMKNEGDER